MLAREVVRSTDDAWCIDVLDDRQPHRLVTPFLSYDCPAFMMAFIFFVRRDHGSSAATKWANRLMWWPPVPGSVPRPIPAIGPRASRSKGASGTTIGPGGFHFLLGRR